MKGKLDFLAALIISALLSFVIYIALNNIVESREQERKELIEQRNKNWKYIG